MAEQGHRRSPGLEPSLRSAASGSESFNRRSAASGFTLIEMMVALAVFSLAALALIRLEGATIKSTGTLDATLLAQIVARNVAVESLTDAQPPVIGESRGVEQNGGRLWSWHRVASPLGDGKAMQIEVSVTDPAGTTFGHLTVVRRPDAVRPVTTPGVRP